MQKKGRFGAIFNNALINRFLKKTARVSSLWVKGFCAQNKRKADFMNPHIPSKKMIISRI